MMRYAIVIEKGENKAIAFHIEGLRADGLEIPEPTTSIAYVDVKAR